MTLLDVIRARERAVRAAHDQLLVAGRRWLNEPSHASDAHRANERGLALAIGSVDGALVALKAAEALRERADATGDSLCECVTSEAGAHLARECRRTTYPATTEGAAT